MKKREIILALAMVVAMGLTACTPQEVEPVNAPEPSSSSEPIVSSEPKETPSEAVPSDVPVSSDVEEAADIEGESNIGKSVEVKTEVEDKTPSGNVSTNSSAGTGGNTSKPSTGGKPAGWDDAFGGSEVESGGWTDAEREAFENAAGGAPQGQSGGDSRSNEGLGSDLSGGFGGTGMTPEEKEAWDNAGGAPGGGNTSSSEQDDMDEMLDRAQNGDTGWDGEGGFTPDEMLGGFPPVG